MTALSQVQIERAPFEQVSVDTVLQRGVNIVMPEEGLRALLEQRRCKLYLGIDPTSPNLHIGHMVPLRKLAQLQALGHEVILLFGTFTGMIGDPSDKSATRQRLTAEQVAINVATYREQAGRILDLTPNAANPVTVVYNHEWLAPLGFAEIVEMASNFTVNELTARDTYRKRLESGTPLYLHEFMYGLMQGYDSVALGVDFEVGGKDQIPNMLAGRTLMKAMSGREKWVMGLKLIEAPDGTKMGKTTGNVVNIEELPEVIFEAIMSWPDSAIGLGLELLTSVPMEIVAQVTAEMALIQQGKSTVNPVEIKRGFAYRVVVELLGVEAADYARDVFNLVKVQRQLPPRMKELVVPQGTSLSTILVDTGLATDPDNARSKLTQQAVKIDGKPVRKDQFLPVGQYVVELGKNSIKNVRKVFVT